MARMIPATMMTQHPDSASRYVSVRDEPQEAIEALTPQPIGLGIQEVMIDYEGKLTPYHQTAEITLGLMERGLVPGSDVLVTPRIPNASRETAFHQLMALMSVIESNFQLQQAGSAGGIREVIVPMVATSEELVEVRRRLEDVIELGHKEFGMDRDPNAVQLIPLIEEVPELLAAGELVSGYIRLAREQGYVVDDLRVMFGRSDSAMVYGMVPSVLAVKIAIADCSAACEGAGIRAYPIFGGGALPFRGHVTLANLDGLAADFAGIRTITVQSGIRYDYGKGTTMQLSTAAIESLADGKAPELDEAGRRELLDLVGVFTCPYLTSFPRLIPVVTALADIMPRQRDRLARKSAVGYARDAAQPAKLASMMPDRDIAARVGAIEVGRDHDLPRAISFTGTLYSIGLPPEFIGTGRGLMELAASGGDSAVERFLELYPGLRRDLEWAARYVNIEAAAGHLPESLVDEIRQDLGAVKEFLGIEPGPVTPDDRRYHMLLETLQPMLRQLTTGGAAWPGEAADIDLASDWISRLGRLRGSLG